MTVWQGKQGTCDSVIERERERYVLMEGRNDCSLTEGTHFFRRLQYSVSRQTLPSWLLRQTDRQILLHDARSIEILCITWEVGEQNQEMEVKSVSPFFLSTHHHHLMWHQKLGTGSNTDRSEYSQGSQSQAEKGRRESHKFFFLSLTETVSSSSSYTWRVFHLLFLMRRRRWWWCLFKTGWDRSPFMFDE